MGILLLGLLVRLLHFSAIAGTPLLQFPIVHTYSDIHAFWEWAQRILAGDWLGRDTYHPYFEWMQAVAPLETWYRWWGGKEIFHQAPMYPYLVAALLAVSRNSLAFVILVQLVLGALQPLLMFWLGRRLFGTRVGLVAAAMTALYGPFIFVQGTLLRDWLPPILDTVALLALLRAGDSGRSRAWLLAGAALGLSYVTKPTILLFIPLALVWIWREHGRAWRKAAVACALVAAGFLLVLSPVLVRNVLVGAKPLAVSTRLAEGFIIGNAADGDPVGLFRAPASMRSILERSEGRLGAVIRETLKTYQGDYGRFFRTQALKLRGVVNPYEVANNVDFYYGREVSPLLWLTLGFGLIFPLGLAGGVLSAGAGAKPRLLMLYFLGALIGLWLTTIRWRYRLPLVPPLTVYAAVFVVGLYDAIRQRRIPRAVCGALVCLAVALVQHRVLALTWPGYYIHTPEYVLSGHVYASEGKLDRAVAEMVRLREKVEANFPNSRVVPDASLLEGDFRARWAKQLLEEGKQLQARSQAEQAEAAYARRPDLSYPHYNLGLLYLRLGEPAKAGALFDRFLTLEPEGPLAEKVRSLRARLQD